MNNEELDEIRGRMQKALADSKRQQLRDEFGMEMDYVNPALPPEAENEWFDYILEFERQFENAQTITVREFIGNPAIQSVEEIPVDGIEEALESLLELLYEHYIVIDFSGDWDNWDAYRYITEELLDEETTDMKIDGMYSHFDAATPAYEAEFWVEHFVWDLFSQERSHFLDILQKQPWYNMNGEPVSATEIVAKIETIWERMPVIERAFVQPISTEAVKDEATVTAVVAWPSGEDERQQVEAFFRLQPSPYTGWDVVQTSLLDKLLDLA